MPLQQNCTVPSMLNSLILHVQEPLVMKQILLVGVVMFTSVSFCLYMFFFQIVFKGIDACLYFVMEVEPIIDL